jgi:hypothetical protein
MWRVVLVGIALLLMAACGDTTPGAPAVTGGKTLVLVGEPTFTNTSGLVIAAGRVKNEAPRPYTAFIVVTLFDEAGKIVGTCNGAVNDVPPGEEVTYQAVSAGQVTAPWTRVEAKIQTPIAR